MEESSNETHNDESEPEQHETSVRKSKCAPSLAWEYFNRADNLDLAICKICDKRMSFKGASTANLLRHVRTKHGAKFSSDLESLHDSKRLHRNLLEVKGKRRPSTIDGGTPKKRQVEVATANGGVMMDAVKAYQNEEGQTIIFVQANAAPDKDNEIVISNVESTAYHSENSQAVLDLGKIMASENIVEEHPENPPESPSEGTTEVPVVRSSERLAKKNGIIANASTPRRKRLLSTGAHNGSSQQTTPPHYKEEVPVKKDDTFDCFGKYAASLLRNFPSQKRALALQKEILVWLIDEQTKAEFGK